MHRHQLASNLSLRRLTNFLCDGLCLLSQGMSSILSIFNLMENGTPSSTPNFDHISDDSVRHPASVPYSRSAPRTSCIGVAGMIKPVFRDIHFMFLMQVSFGIGLAWSFLLVLRGNIHLYNSIISRRHEGRRRISYPLDSHI